MEIIGHHKQWKFLKKAAEMGNFPHALLFSGQKSLGKRTLAIELAKLLINDEKCEIHPDFTFIKPKFDIQDIQISQIRDLIWKLSLHPYSASYKIAIIDKAHQMNREAQNCFLKTLEEPKGKSLLILITEHPELLYSTILSRVQKIKFFPVKKSEIENYLITRGAAHNQAESLSSLCSGKPGLAVRFFENEEELVNQEKLISDINKIGKSDFAFRFKYAKELSERKEDVRETLNIWLNHFRNLLFSRLAKLPEDRARIVDGGSGSVEFTRDLQYPLLKIKKIISLLQSTDYLIFATNANPKLALEILLMEL